MRRHSGMLQASLCLILVGASFLIVQAQENGYPRYSPCAPPTLVNKASPLKLYSVYNVESPSLLDLKPTYISLCLQGDPFVVGIAYWPGGTVLEWCVML